MEFASRCCTLRESVFLLLRCERSDNFLKTRIATQRVPLRVEFQNAIAEGVRDTLHRGDLFDGTIFLTSPGVDLRQINGDVHAVDGIFGDGQQFAGAAAFLYCLFFALEAGVDRKSTRLNSSHGSISYAVF